MDHLSSFFTVREVADRLGVTKSAIYNWLDRGLIRGVRLVGTWRIDPDDLDTFIKTSWNDFGEESR